MPPGERNKAIDNRYEIWRDLKGRLKELSHGKCWYCESLTYRIIGGGDVDHYRPKNRVEECPSHPGYWWLAFDWRNYRYSCERCNRKDSDNATGTRSGKHTHFPLWNESKRISDECDYDDLLEEDPLLLDPTVAVDPPLLTFEPDGTARPARDEQKFPVEYLRAEVSIRLYHLNHTELKEKRQFDTCYKVKDLVKKADKYFRRWQKDRSNTDARSSYQEVMEDLAKMINERTEHSATARATLKTFRRADRVWVDELLTA